jgi:hypothetical protein
MSRHLKRNTRPCTVPSEPIDSASSEYSSSTCTPETPNSEMSSVKTPGSDSMVHLGARTTDNTCAHDQGDDRHDREADARERVPRAHRRLTTLPTPFSLRDPPFQHG